jgi:hypothetical protein
MFKWHISYTAETNPWRFTISFRKSNRQPQCTMELECEKLAQFVGLSKVYCAMYVTREQRLTSESSLPCPCYGGTQRKQRYSSTHSLTSAFDGGKWLTSRPGSFTTRKDPLNSRLCRSQSWYGRLGENKYLLLLPGFKFLTVQHVAIRLFPCSQKPTTCLFPKTDNQCLSSLPIYWRTILILSSHLRSWAG